MSRMLLPPRSTPDAGPGSGARHCVARPRLRSLPTLWYRLARAGGDVAPQPARGRDPAAVLPPLGHVRALPGGDRPRL